MNSAGTVTYSPTLVTVTAAKTSYAQALKVTCPAGAGYKAFVSYRPVAGTGSWTVTAKSAAFTVTP